MSPGSRGPADIVASSPAAHWYIQVKASSGIPRLKGRELRALRKLAIDKRGLAVVSTVQPFSVSTFSTGNFAMNFYEIDSWERLDPVVLSDGKGSTLLKSKAGYVG